MLTKDFGLTKFEQRLLLLIFDQEKEMKIVTTKTLAEDETIKQMNMQFRIGKALKNLEKYLLICTYNKNDMVKNGINSEFRKFFINHVTELRYPKSRLIELTNIGKRMVCVLDSMRSKKTSYHSHGVIEVDSLKILEIFKALQKQHEN